MLLSLTRSRTNPAHPVESTNPSPRRRTSWPAGHSAATSVARLPPTKQPYAHHPHTPSSQATEGQLQIFDPVGNRTEFPVERSYAGTFPQAAWSPSGTHLIYTSARGLMLIAFDPHRNQLIAPGGSDPAWQPQRDRSTEP